MSDAANVATRTKTSSRGMEPAPVHKCMDGGMRTGMVMMVVAFTALGGISDAVEAVLHLHLQRAPSFEVLCVQ